MAKLLELSAPPTPGVRATTRGNPGHLSIDLDVTPGAVPIVRTIVRAHLTLWGLSGLNDRVALTVSELLTNVVRHVAADVRTGAPSARLTVTRLPGALNVCVRDASLALPQLSYADLDAEAGRGLSLVMAYADYCGSSPVSGGKDVWANFLISDSDTSERGRGQAAS
ncbi:ATP-binding protein [Streptomyces sp. NBC_00631]|uniref:ATP-binding protein n=1 Tax=Streptomyces sp. NBC_00631 TaxID=2975793 RepID=UPI0030E53298